MRAFLTSGIYLQKIELSDTTKIIIKILRNIDRVSSGSRDYFKDATPMVLHIKDNGRTITLDFDPWSNINVIKDNHIDQEDIDAITELAVAYDRQSTIGPENGAFLRFLADAPYFWVVIEKWALSGQQPHPLSAFDAFDAKIFKPGSPFEMTTHDPETGYQIRVGDDLQQLAKAFSRLSL